MFQLKKQLKEELAAASNQTNLLKNRKLLKINYKSNNSIANKAKEQRQDTTGLIEELRYSFISKNISYSEIENVLILKFYDVFLNFIDFFRKYQRGSNCNKERNLRYFQ